ncbi:redox-sensing transcriptional repressor [Quadrisphaera granulorum]|uniref:Redox-sensing transcriptional repressor Rex n=1 Tax=Quadrisphaera granulorum TaxID=317664 RepID=A0A316A8T8_9ACTN|nr:redox-sensing transcriptional repressor Rex [Quadrisphaera granulorum]PWJ53264.1 redox-sensing transcriptional repressor [Quadrisphaera granulorum]SZE96938.1 redox-sensing transcriptional repressor [Quadrisphaera granulorum]
MTDPHPAPPLRAPRDGTRGVPDATVARLPVYLRVLTGLGERGVTTVSSEELALAAGVGSATLRKDLSHLGSYGVRGVGYDVGHLVQHVGRCLGLAEEWRVVIVGIGSLGHALANYGGFAPLGTRVVALVDSDPSVVGEQVAGLEVQPAERIVRLVSELGVRIAVLAVPAASAQAACDAVVAAGITSVLSFAPVELQVPAGVELRRVDLSTELGILAFRERRRAAADGEEPVVVLPETLVAAGVGGRGARGVHAEVAR